MNPSTTEQLQQIFQAIFEDRSLLIKPELTADDIDMWDSLTHLALISAVEEHFKITISFNQIVALENVGDLLNCIENLLAEQ